MEKTGNTEKLKYEFETAANLEVFINRKTKLINWHFQIGTDSNHSLRMQLTNSASGQI